MFGPKLLHQYLEVVLANAMLPPVYPVRLDELSSMRVIRNIAESEMIVLSDPDAPPQVCNVYRDCEACSPCEVRVKIMHSYAHPQGVFLYRIEMGNRKLVIATDTEGYAGGDRHLIQFARGADLLIHDAELTTEEYLGGHPARQGWGHSTWEMAVEVAQAAGAKRLVLTHHNVHDDAFMENIERQTQARFSAVIVAREGLTLEVKREE